MNLRSLRFLVVEDDEIQREALVVQLEDLGALHVAAADNGRSGLAAFLAAEPAVDVIISDLQMPEMDGVEFIRRVGDTGRPVGIVLASAVDAAVLGAVENMAAAYGIPLLGTLPKPVLPEHLARLFDGGGPGPGAAAAAAQARATTPAPTADEVRTALAGGAFEPWFQPKIELASGRIRGFEAVARWRRGEGQGFVGPDVFIPLMEAHGLIDALTLAIVAQAAQACRRWRAAGQDWGVSVNLSVRSLARVEFADRLADVVREAGLAPGAMVLEVTESASADAHLGSVLENLTRLRLKGFGLSLDDFGTGYSSMQQLGRVAFTELKIDPSFVRDAGKAGSRQAILASSVDTARRMRIDSVAEGIETPDECRMLRELGFTLGQGYCFGRPMPAPALPTWCHEWPHRLEALGWPAPAAAQ